MQVDDISAVMEIENIAFATPWPAGAYREEVARNELAHCYVLETEGSELVGYGCLWLIIDEAHISTLATAPVWRGRGLGELLLLALIREAVTMGAEMATLEVRVSNRAAQELYTKYGFQVVGRRKRYYQDNQEDALIMTVAPLDEAYQAALEQHRVMLYARLSAGR